MDIYFVEAMAVVAKEFGRDDVRWCVPGLVTGGKVQLPQQFSFVSAGIQSVGLVNASRIF